MSAAEGRAALRKDSVFPAQSWNSSHTRVGFRPEAMAWANSAPAERGNIRMPATEEQKAANSRLVTPLRSNSVTSQSPFDGMLDLLARGESMGRAGRSVRRLLGHVYIALC